MLIGEFYFFFFFSSSSRGVHSFFLRIYFGKELWGTGTDDMRRVNMYASTWILTKVAELEDLE